MSAGTFQESLLFLSKYLRYPKQIGSVTPSSRFLSAKMVSSIPWDQVKAIAELGAGTGAITKFIQKSNVNGAKILLFETEPYLRNRLQSNYPEYSCFPDAIRIQDAMEHSGVEELDGIISGLPFFNFERSVRERLLNEIDVALKPNGLFIAFQYSLQMKRSFQQKFEVEQVSFVPLNLPPAFVTVCRKK